MSNNLSEVIESIYRDYQPLNNIGQQLFSQKNSDGFKTFVDTKTSHLSPQEKDRINNEIFDWGPLTCLKERDDIFDIIVQGPETIYYETNAGLTKHHDQFLSKRSFQNFIELVIKESGIVVNQKDPFANGKIESFRLHIVVSPICEDTVLTLRRHNNTIYSLDNLLESQFLSSKQEEWIRNIIDTKKNFLVIGPTGSGKTTFLNALIGEIKSAERLVIVEDTDEIKTNNPIAAKLLSREICPSTLTPITMEDLVKQSLRMRPDRLVIGEVRGQEAKDLLQALATGHTGSMGTLHAHSAKQALLRLEMLIQMGAPQWSLHSIRQLIQMSLDYLIVLNEDRQNKGIKEICKITSHESFGLLLENVEMKSFSNRVY